jgi:hypothetical protein
MHRSVSATRCIRFDNSQQIFLQPRGENGFPAGVYTILWSFLETYSVSGCQYEYRPERIALEIDLIPVDVFAVRSTEVGQCFVEFPFCFPSSMADTVDLLRSTFPLVDSSSLQGHLCELS